MTYPRNAIERLIRETRFNLAELESKQELIEKELGRPIQISAISNLKDALKDLELELNESYKQKQNMSETIDFDSRIARMSWMFGNSEGDKQRL